MAVETVLGKVEKKDLGIITPHEHTFIDLRGFYTDRPVRGCDDPYNAPVTMDKLGILSRDPYALRDNLLMDDYETQRDEIMQFKNAGGATVVDATTTGIGKDPERLKKLAKDTGLNIIAGAGYYVGSMLPPELDTMSAEEIAETRLENINLSNNKITDYTPLGKISGGSTLYLDDEAQGIAAEQLADANISINP